LLLSSVYDLQVTTRQTKLFPGSIPASNSGLYISSPYVTTVQLDYDIFTIGTTVYTRPQLKAAIDAHTLVTTGLRITTSSSSPNLDDVTFDFFDLKLTITINSFWGFTAGQTFNNMLGFYHDSLFVTGGLWNKDHLSQCPSVGRTNYPLHSGPVVSGDPIHYGALALSSHFRSMTVTDAQAHLVCDPLKAISDFYYNACWYDVTQGGNPNLANVIISSLNAVVHFLRDEGLLANFSSLLNVTANTFHGVQINEILPDFPSISSFFPEDSSSSGGNGLNGAMHLKPSFWLLLSSLMIVFFRL